MPNHSTTPSSARPPAVVRLRRVVPDDAELIEGWRADPGMRRYQPLRQLSLAELRRQLAERTARVVDPGLDGEVQWIVETGQGPVGWVTLKEIGREHGLGEIGYGIGERFRGRGYATAAVRALLPIAFGAESADLWRLEAVAAVENVASRRVLERAGFVFEGVAQGLLVIAGERVDHARYGLLRSDWERENGEVARRVR